MKKAVLKFYFLFFSVFLFEFKVYSQNDTNTNKNETLKYAEQMPEFPGGVNALIDFINKNIIYPKQAVRKKIEGTVYVKFIINKEGYAVNFEIMDKNKLGYGLEEAAIEVLKKMPKWEPGYQNKIPVEVSMVIPITFKVKN
ncbi:MAG: energy transducer TonB [Bacteroidetes bacterium]|nr:energy transducer TonB [Bacteroidota bacterium]